MNAMKVSSVYILLLMALLKSCMCCSVSSSGPITCENLKGILKYHNEARAKVARGEVQKLNPQSAAENMLEMRWSAELAYKSSRWAEYCLMEHSPKSDRPNTGENLARQKGQRSDSYLDLVPLTEMWFKEVEQYGYEDKFTMNNGHYAQMIWGSSQELGCGYARFPEGKGYSTLLVCRYRPAGNMVGKPPYIKGQPNCAAHGLKESITYKGLCTKLTEDEQKSYDPCADTYNAASTPALSNFLISISFILLVTYTHLY